MSSAVAGLLQRAREDIEVAGDLSARHPRAAVSRAYYAMFNVARALLHAEGLEFSKHSAVIASFGREFAKTERLDRKYHAYIREAFALRSDADYALYVTFSSAKALEMVSWAKEFLEAAEALLKAEGHAGS